jgi:hypothetical protein
MLDIAAFQSAPFHATRTEMEARSLLILGDGTFAVEALDIAESAGGFTPLGFVNSVVRPDVGSSPGGY